LIGRAGGKVLIEFVFSHGQVVVGVSGNHKLPLSFRSNLVAFHQPDYWVFRTRTPFFLQIHMDTRTFVGFPTLPVNLFDLGYDAFIFLLRVRSGRFCQT
jgi:hypothetical protein